MTRAKWLAAVGVGLLLAGSGCVSCGHEVCKKVLDVGPHCDVPLCDRRHVYVVLVNGLTPTGLDCLRAKLAEQGFDKVYSGQLVHGPWLYHEMKRVHRCDPSARFVVVGYDVGCALATGLARGATGCGVPVDAVVLLNPVGAQDMAACQIRTVVVRSGCNDCPVPHTEQVTVPDANHFTLPSRPQTADLVYAVAHDSAVKVVHPPVPVEAEWRYEGAPPPRCMPDPGPGFPEDWFFLHDQLGPHATPLVPPLYAPTPDAGPPGLPNSPAVPGQPLPLPAPKKLP
jgi:hypothetical protein